MRVSSEAVAALEHSKVKLTTQLNVLKIAKDEAVRKHKDVSLSYYLTTVVHFNDRVMILDPIQPYTTSLQH